MREQGGKVCGMGVMGLIVGGLKSHVLSFEQNLPSEVSFHTPPTQFQNILL